MTSIGRLPDKDRRRERRKNHILKDLRSGKYFQRVIPSKNRKKQDEYLDEDEDLLL